MAKRASERGRLFTRGRAKRYYLQFYVNGKQIVRRLADADGNPITDQREAEKARNRVMASYVARDEVQLRQAAWDALRSAEETAAKLEEEMRDKLKTGDAWTTFLQSPERPDSGDATLRQYAFQWQAFADWLAKSYPDLVHVEDVTQAIGTEYSQHLSTRGNLRPGTINKHVRLLKLVFRVLNQTATNPFDKIKSRKERQEHRKELPWDTLCQVCDLAEGETKTLLFIGIYTGQRLGDCCCLTWDSVDLMRPWDVDTSDAERRGWIILTPSKTASRNEAPLHIPIMPSLRTMLEAIPPKQRRGYVLPDLAAEYERSSDRVTSRIQKLLMLCGVLIHKPGTGLQPDKEGVYRHTGKRAVLQYGFHSLRHTTVTLLQESGVPRAVVQAIVGHNTVAMTQRYTHVGKKAIAEAMSKLPAMESPIARALPESTNLVEGIERSRLAELARVTPLERVREAIALLEGRSLPASPAIAHDPSQEQ